MKKFLLAAVFTFSSALSFANPSATEAQMRPEMEIQQSQAQSSNEIATEVFGAEQTAQALKKASLKERLALKVLKNKVEKAQKKATSNSEIGNILVIIGVIFVIFAILGFFLSGVAALSGGLALGILLIILGKYAF